MGRKIQFSAAGAPQSALTSKQTAGAGDSSPFRVGSFLSSPSWQQERATRLHGQFQSVERRRQTVGSVRRCFKPFARRWNGKRFKTDSARQIRFAMGTLLNLFYFWRANGRTPECLLLRYRPTTEKKMTDSLLAEFVATSTCPGVDSLAEGYRFTREAHYQLWAGDGEPPVFPSRNAFMRALSGKARRAMIDLQKGNRAVLTARAELRNAFG